MSNKENTIKMTRATKRETLPKLRFPEFRDAHAWVEYGLGELFSNRQESGFLLLPLLSLTDREGVIPQEDSNRKNNSSLDRSKYLRVCPGDIAYNTMRMWEGRSALVGLEGVVSPAYTVCKPNDQVDGSFFCFYFKTQQLIEQFRKYSQGLVKDTLNLKFSAFSEISIQTPFFSEQQKIAECLSTIDELITAQTQKLNTLKTHKKGLMQQLFPAEGETLPKLRFPEFQDAGEWEENFLDSKVIKVGSGITPKGGDKNYKNNGRSFVRSQNVGWGELLLDDVAYIDEQTHATFPSTEIENGDVLLNITGASIGRCVVADSRIKGGNVNQHVCIIRLIAEDLNSEYLKQYLLSRYGQKQIDSFQAGGNRQGLNFAQVRSFSIPHSSQEEQTKIAQFLLSIDELITAQTQKLATLKTHKKGLMQQLFPALDEVQR